MVSEFQPRCCIPTTGGQDLGRRTEETVAVEAGASMATFFFDEGFFSPSRFRFLVLRSDMFSAFLAGLDLFSVLGP